MGVFCQILINRPRTGGHKAGRPVTGVVRYTVDEPGRYKGIILSLIGKGKCEWQERRHKQTYFYTGKEVYVVQHLSIHEKGPEDVFILPIGTYERPFTFVLPHNIPSSFENSICTIKYKLVLKFERPGFFSIHKKFDTEINVTGCVNTTTPEGVAVTELEKTLFTPLKKRKYHVHLQTEIPNTVFRPRENVQVKYKVINDSDVIITSVKAELICYTTYIADCGNSKTSTETISDCTVETISVPDRVIANLMSKMSLLDSLNTIQNSKIMIKEYCLKVTLRLPMPYINAFMNIPIVIGHKYGDDDVESSVPESEEFLEDPPSYFEVMNECKEDKDFSVIKIRSVNCPLDEIYD